MKSLILATVCVSAITLAGAVTEREAYADIDHTNKVLNKSETPVDAKSLWKMITNLFLDDSTLVPGVTQVTIDEIKSLISSKVSSEAVRKSMYDVLGQAELLLGDSESTPIGAKELWKVITNLFIDNDTLAPGVTQEMIDELKTLVANLDSNEATKQAMYEVLEKAEKLLDDSGEAPIDGKELWRIITNLFIDNDTLAPGVTQEMIDELKTLVANLDSNEATKQAMYEVLKKAQDILNA